MEDNDLDNKLKKAYEVLSSANEEAYKDIYLLSNTVLSKNPFTSKFLYRFLYNEIPQPHSFYTVTYKILKYYAKSFAHFMLYISKFIEYFMTGQRFSNSCKNKKEFIVIDTFFLTEKIQKAIGYSDPYFPGLVELLKKLNKSYVYLPVFSGSIKPFVLYRVLKILKRENVPILTEYQLLSLIDLIYIFHFILVYPFHVLKFARTLSRMDYEKHLLKYELIDTLGYTTFLSFSRYLQGKRIARMDYENIKIISWDENQVIHKNLYKGLRVSEKIKIYGAQLFLYAKSILNILTDFNEVKHGLVPDKIISNGAYYVPGDNKLNYMVGASLRYSKIFDTTVKKENQDHILVTLPYFPHEIEDTLEILKGADLSAYSVILKAHPATKIDKYVNFLPINYKVVENDTYELFKTTKIVIANASGTLIEATSLGIPAIVARNKKKINFNPLPEYGKDIIWAEVSNSVELIRQIKVFEASLDNNLCEIHSIASNYKKMFFCEISEENIIEAFDLKLQSKIQKTRRNEKILSK